MTLSCRSQVQVAFNNGLFDLALTYTDITPYVSDDAPIKAVRGRGNELSKFEKGTLSCRLRNETRIFDSTWAAAPLPYRGNIKPLRPTQLLAEYPWLPGLLPTDGARNVGWAALANAAAPTVSLGGAAYLVPPLVNQGSMLVWSAVGAGNCSVQSAKIPTGGNQPITAHARVNSSTTARIMQIGIICWDVNNVQVGATFFGTGINIPVGAWTGPLTVSMVTAANVVSCSIVILAQGAATGDVFNADAIVFDLASQYIAKPIHCSYSESWKKKYQGREAWVEYQAADFLKTLAVKNINSVGYQKLVQSNAPVHYWRLSQGFSFTGATSPDIGSSPTPAVVHGYITWGIPGPLLADLGSAAGFLGDVNNGGFLDVGSQSWFNGTHASTWVGWIQTPVEYPSIAGSTVPCIWVQGCRPDPAAAYGIAVLYAWDNGVTNPAVGSQYTFGLFYWASGNRFAGGAPTSAVLLPFKPPQTIPNPNFPWNTKSSSFYDGAWHLVGITRDADGRTYHFYVDGQAVPTSLTFAQVIGGYVSNADQSVTIPATVPLPSGKTLIAGNDGAPTFQGGLAEIFQQSTALTAAQHAALYNLAQLVWQGQTPGQRIGVVLDVLGFPAAQRNLDAGSTVLQKETGYLTGSVGTGKSGTPLANTNSLQYINYVEDSDSGWFFATAAGWARYISRQTFLKPPYNAPVWTLGDVWPTSHTELPLVDVDIDTSDTLIYTEATGTQVGVGSQYVAGDSISISNYGQRTLSLSTMLNQSTQDVINILTTKLMLYKVPGDQLLKLIINPLDNDDLWVMILSAEIGDMVQLNLRPPPTSSGSSSLKGRIQKITHTINRRTWRTEFDLAKVDPTPYLLLNDAVLGKLDSGNIYAF